MNHQGTKAPREEISSELNSLATQVVDAAFAVHIRLGPGLLESVYELCLAHTYLKLFRKRLGLLINFNVPRIKEGISRLVL